MIISLSAIPIVMTLNLSPAEAVSKDAANRKSSICQVYKGSYNPSSGITEAEWNMRKNKLLPFCDGTTFHCTTHRKGGIFGMVQGVCNAKDLCKDQVLYDACKEQCINNRRVDDKTTKIKAQLAACPVSRPATVNMPQSSKIEPATQESVLPGSGPEMNVPTTPMQATVQAQNNPPMSNQRELTSLPIVREPVAMPAPIVPDNTLNDLIPPVFEEHISAPLPRPLPNDTRMSEENIFSTPSIPAPPPPPSSYTSSIPAAPIMPEMEHKMSDMHEMEILNDTAGMIPPPPPPIPSTKKSLANSAPAAPSNTWKDDRGNIDRNSNPLSSDRNDLLAEIRSGKQLKQVAPQDQQRPKAKDANSMADILAGAMDQRRNAIHEEPTEDDNEAWD